MLELISVHVPKCAGTAFRTALAQAYGAAAIHHDYADRPLDPAAPMHLDPNGFFARRPKPPAGARVVHGHFHAGKYRHLGPACPRIAILRHPVARTISHYKFWLRLAPAGHALHAYMRESGLDLVGFARLPFIRHAYARVLFAGLDRREFALIGAVETLASDLPRLATLLGRDLVLPRENAAPASPAISPEQAAQLAELLAEDIEFYEAWRSA